MPFMEYVYVNEVIGRSSFAMVALGTHSLQDSIMLREFASPHWRDQYLEPLVQGEIFPSFGMTEPEVASSVQLNFKLLQFLRMASGELTVESGLLQGQQELLTQL